MGVPTVHLKLNTGRTGRGNPTSGNRHGKDLIPGQHQCDHGWHGHHQRENGYYHHQILQQGSHPWAIWWSSRLSSSRQGENNHHQRHDQDNQPCNDKKSAVWLIAIFALLDLAQLQTQHWLAELQNLSIILLKIITNTITTMTGMTIILIIISCNQSTCNSSTRTGAGIAEPSVGWPAKFTIFRTWVWWWWLYYR